MKVMRIILRLALVAITSLAIVLPVRGAIAGAQAPAATNDMNGTWFNVDAKTRRLVQIEIHGNKIHPYGACQPDPRVSTGPVRGGITENPCDWGTLKAEGLAQNVDSGAAAALVAKKSTSFSRVQITLSLERD